MITKQISVSDFKTHCIQEIRAVENGEAILELTRHGKKVAVVRSPDPEESQLDFASWLGSGKGTVTFEAGYAADAPAWVESDWED